MATKKKGGTSGNKQGKAAKGKVSGNKIAVKTKPTEQTVRVIVDVIVRQEPDWTGMRMPIKTFAAESSFELAGLEDNEPNFEFKFTLPNGVGLSRINIDSNVFEGEVLGKASETDSDGKVVVKVFVSNVTTPMPMIIDVIGEPNRVATFTLKFSGNDVFKDDDAQKITVKSSRRGRLTLPAVNLP